MYVVGSFSHSHVTELVLTNLVKKGIPKENLLAIPLDQQFQQPSLLDSMHRSDGVSFVDGAAAVGTIFMVLGTIYGFVLPWGPIIWGLIGLLFGALVGLIGDLLIRKRRFRGPKENSNLGKC